MPLLPLRIGTAGWTIPRAHATALAGEGSHLARYARTLDCAEINATFYRSPRVSTWTRWAEQVPPGFRFSVKAPRAITHDARLACTEDQLRGFLAEAGSLGERLGPLLFQLPPKLAFDRDTATRFLSLLRQLHAGSVAFEPRHGTWFTVEASQLFEEHRVARVAADPPVAGTVLEPGGWGGLAYYRLHGSPRRYYSPYEQPFLAELATSIARIRPAAEVWCIFDNTASGAALGNALTLHQMKNH